MRGGGLNEPCAARYDLHSKAESGLRLVAYPGYGHISHHRPTSHLIAGVEPSRLIVLPGIGLYPGRVSSLMASTFFPRPCGGVGAGALACEATWKGYNHGAFLRKEFVAMAY